MNCKWLQSNECIFVQEPFAIIALKGSLPKLFVTEPDQFFCSEHETKDGIRLVNWEKK